MVQRLNKPLLGIAFAITGTIVGALQDALIKWVSADYPLLQILFIRSTVMLLPIAGFLIYRKGLSGFRTKKPAAHGIRVMLQLMVFLPFFFALSRMPLAECLALVMSAPLVMTLLSGPLLNEPVGPKRWGAVVVGFVGVLLMLGQLGDGLDSLGAMAALFSTLMYTLWSIYTRKLSTTESTEQLIFYSALGLLIISGFFMPWQWKQPPIDEWPILGVLGIASMVLGYLLTEAFRYAPVHVVAPYDYLYLVWGSVIGYLVWGDVPKNWTVLGSILVVGSGLFILYREHQVAKQSQVVMQRT